MARLVKKEIPLDPPPVAVFRSAEAFLVAADQQRQWLIENQTIYALFDAMPIYFLYGQSIELMLKACLRARGMTSEDLEKNYRHDLLKLYRKCVIHLHEMDPHARGMSGILAHHFTDIKWYIKFRYVSDDISAFPTLDAVSVFSRALLEAIRPFCNGAQRSFDELADFVRAVERGELPPGSKITF